MHNDAGIGLISVTIDGKHTQVEAGTTILTAARRLDVRIPTLCQHDDLCISGSCRLCTVEVEGQRTLQAACAYPINQATVVKTSSPAIRHARRNILELLISEHWGECYTCHRNGTCELQSLAAEYGIENVAFPKSETPPHKVVYSSPIVRDMNKCIGCFRCVRTCNNLQTVGALGKIGRGNKVTIGTFADFDLMDALCVGCGQCINRCPTAALTERNDSDAVWAAIDDPAKHVVIQTAPAPRAAIAEVFGVEPGTAATLKLNTAIKRMGFDKVFDTNFTADLTIMEEGTELLLRLKANLLDKAPDAMPLPQLTSCSPGWVKFIEHVAPETLPHVSTCKSPQQMFGAVIKTYYSRLADIDPRNIVSVSLMPCTAKKYEADRPEMIDSGLKDVDYSLTTRELGAMIRHAGIDLLNLEDSAFDDPLGLGSGAGIIFGASGGVMEAAIRTAYEIVTGEEVPFEGLNITPVRGLEGVRSAELPIPKAVDAWKFLEGATLKVMIANGLSNARWVLEKLEAGELADYHFIEIMACPGGCLGGGGQPIPTNDDIRKKRAEAIYNEDTIMEYRKSHENPVIKRIYDEFLTDGPCGHKSHELLHTHYKKRGNRIV